MNTVWSSSQSMVHRTSSTYMKKSSTILCQIETVCSDEIVGCVTGGERNESKKDNFKSFLKFFSSLAFIFEVLLDLNKEWLQEHDCAYPWRSAHSYLLKSEILVVGYTLNLKYYEVERNFLRDRPKLPNQVQLILSNKISGPKKWIRKFLVLTAGNGEKKVMIYVGTVF